MNVFFLDSTADSAVQTLLPKHVTNEVLNVTSLLCDVARLAEVPKTFIPFKKNRLDHPWVQWAFQGYSHYAWVARYRNRLVAQLVNKKEKLRLSKDQEALVAKMMSHLDLKMRDKGSNGPSLITHPPLTLPPWYIASTSNELVTRSYKNYYFNEKVLPLPVGSPGAFSDLVKEPSTYTNYRKRMTDGKTVRLTVLHLGIDKDVTMFGTVFGKEMGVDIKRIFVEPEGDKLSLDYRSKDGNRLHKIATVAGENIK